MNSNHPTASAQKRARQSTSRLFTTLFTLLPYALAFCSHGQEYLVKNINTQQEVVGSSPSGFVQVGNSFFYFKATDGVHGTELWRSDGTAEGTTLVSDISVGSASADPASLVNVNGTLFFTATNASGRELWRSDGTAIGTFMVKDINPGPTSSNPTNLVALGNLLYFSALGSPNNTELWVSDGTAGGTIMVKDINLIGSSTPQNLTVLGNLLFFSANNGTNGVELWRSDGTAAGTVMVKDINAGSSSSSPLSLVVVPGGGGTSGTLFFSAITSTNGSELWKSDGTAAGTVLVKDISPGTASSAPQNLVVVNGVLYFSANSLSPTNNGVELWRSDGTATGTLMVKDINPGSASSSPQSLVNVNGTLFFSAIDSINGRELWKSDGTMNGTVMVKDIFSGGASSSPTALVNVNGTLFFSANDGINGNELWKSDGTDAGTLMVRDIRPGTLSSSPQSLANISGALFFSADDGIYGRELWRSDGSAEGTVMVANIRDNDGDSNPASLVLLNNKLIFAANDGLSGTELWSSDGTEGGTVLLKDINFGTNGASPANLVLVNSNLFFAASDGMNGLELWKTDGTEGGTTLVRDINPGLGAGSSPANLTDVNGTLFFSANNGANGFELWKSDGAAAGTVMVKDIFPGAIGSSPSNLVNVNGTLYFAALSPAGGTNTVELWKSDGTDAGTVLIRNFTTGTNSNPQNLVNFNGTLFFTISSVSLGVELWKSDGTDAGTVLVKDIRPGTASSTPRNLQVVGNTLFFSANDGTNGVELWKSDGTTAGTVMVKDILAGAGSSNPTNLVNINGTLYFAASSLLNGTNAGVELWKSDGTAAGTVMVKDIFAGTGSSSPQNLINVNGTLYFSATDGINGRELWQSDGTEEGTFMVGDLTGDSLDSNPGPFTVVADTLFFSAQTPEAGRELFAFILNHPPTVANQIPDQTGVYGSAFNFAMPPDTFVDEDAGQTLSYEASGLPPGISFVSGTLEFGGVPGAAGQYVVTVTATDNGGPVPLSGTTSFIITIGKATPLVSWIRPADIVYGTPLGNGQLNAAGDVAGTFAYSPAAGTVLNAGIGQELSASFSPEDTANYNEASITTVIDVMKASLTAAAVDATRTYGAANPPLNISYSGFVNGENASVLETAPLPSTSAAPESPIGAYPITVSGGSAANYEFSLVPGTLTITPAALTVTANDTSRMYGQVNPILTGTITGIQNNDNITATYSCSATPNSPVGSYAIVPALGDPNGKRTNYSVTLNNGILSITPAPLTVRITGPASGLVQPVNTNIVFTGTFTKSGYSDSYLGYWTFASVGQTFIVVPATVADDTVGCQVSFATPGIYSVTLTVSNEFGPAVMATNVNNDLPAYIVIYDPDGGFVTGGGWISSPAGAYLLDPALVGRATFGFVSKYQKGASFPTGQTQFSFQVADIDFHSTSYEWLVVSGPKAQYKGSGTIDGLGDYGFILTAVDGALNGGGGVDKFRIKIWEKEHGVIVYDNQAGTTDDSFPNTSVQGGNIVIHKE